MLMNELIKFNFAKLTMVYIILYIRDGEWTYLCIRLGVCIYLCLALYLIYACGDERSNHI